MAANPKKQHYTMQQYLMLLQNGDRRLEFDHGEIYEMPGSSANHATISANLWRAIDDALGEDAACRAYVVDRVVRVKPEVTFLPDVVVTCDLADQGEAFFLDSPCVVAEVLSKSTEARDRTYKLVRYQANEHVQEILFVSQFVQRVEVISRLASGEWDYHDYRHGEQFTLTSIDVTIPITDIYRKLSVPILEKDDGESAE